MIANNGGDGIAMARAARRCELGRHIVIVSRNHGLGNGGLFVDIGDDGFGNSSGLQGDAAAPVIASATDTRIAGTAAPGATVQVFENGGSPGSLDDFLGQAVATSA